MKYILSILLILSLTACDPAPPRDPNTQIYAINRTVREQYYNECIHENKNFDWLVQQGNLWVSVQNTCRTSAYLRSIFPTTLGELANHSDWVEESDANGL
jgi:hypothetical protein